MLSDWRTPDSLAVFIHGPDLDLLEGIESTNNRSLAFGSNLSTSGHLMPTYYLNRADPKCKMYKKSKNK